MTPGFNAMLMNWVPHHEKSSAAALYTSGNQISGILIPNNLHIYF